MSVVPTKGIITSKPAASIVYLRSKDVNAAMAAMSEAFDELEPMGRDFEGVNRARVAILKSVQFMRDAGMASVGGEARATGASK